MIPLNFYRDDNYVYYNNPNGITKKITIADFEAMMSGESELPEYSSSSQGKVLSVDSDGDLEWASLPPDELPAYTSSNQGEVLSVDSDGDLEWASLPPAELPAYTSSDGGKVLTVNNAGTGVEWAESGGGSSDNQYLLTLDGEGDIDNSVSDVSSAVYSGKTIVAPFTALYTVFDINTNKLLFILLDGVDNLGSSVASMAYRVMVYVPKQDNSGFTYSTEYSYTTNMSIV